MIDTKTLGSVLLAILLAAVISMPANAQSERSRHPGYVDLTKIGRLDQLFTDDPVIEVNIEGALLNLVAEASRYEDPELADMLKNLEGIYVRGYETKDAGYEAISDRARMIGKELELDGWSTIVKVRERDEDVQMYIRSEGDRVSGMVVMVAERNSDETIFLNIVGQIDPAQIGRIGRKFQIGSFGGF